MFLDVIRATIANNGYEVITCGVASAFFAQVIKFILFTVKSRRVNFKIFSTTGGMPSSHSAGVMGLSTMVGILQGYDSILFAMSLAAFSPCTNAGNKIVLHIGNLLFIVVNIVIRVIIDVIIICVLIIIVVIFTIIFFCVLVCLVTVF